VQFSADLYRPTLWQQPTYSAANDRYSGAVPAVSITVSSTVTVPDFSNAAAPAPPSSAAPVPSSSATPSSVAVPISQASGKLITPTARRAHVVT
jgi:hypothetical protein